MYLTVSPAYGRDYRTQKAAKQAWAEDKDFVIETFGPHMGQKINRQDARKQDVGPITIRFAGLRKLVVVNQ